MFCGDIQADVTGSEDYACAVDLATFFAHVDVESEGLFNLADPVCSSDGTNSYCDDFFDGMSNRVKTDYSHNQFYGRGPLMLKYSTNYERVSKAFLGMS